MMRKDEKAALRQKIKGIWTSLSPKKLEIINQEVAKCIHEAPFWKETQSLLAYLSFGWEISLDPLILMALAEGKRVYVPRISQKGQMEFLRLHSLAEEDLEYNRLHIREVPEGAEVYTYRAGTSRDKEVLLLPGLAFTKDGLRLGRGGGYYDRFLEKNRDLKTIGICWQGVLLPHIPVENHDRPVDGLCCEGELFFCRGDKKGA